MKNHHEELRWQKHDEIEWKMKRIRLKPCGDLDGVSDEMDDERLNSGKEKMKTLELEFIPEEQTPKEGFTHFDEIRITFIVCLSFIKLNWGQPMDFAYYLFFLKKNWEVTYRTLEKVFMNHR